jgi:hypothetical protein
MKINYKQLYLGLNQQAKSLRDQLNPIAEVEKVNEIPDNFNQIGWDATIEKVELMVSKMKQLKEVKGKRLTPQFYRSIYNRALIACGEADKLIETLAAESTDINYEAEVTKLNGEIVQLQSQIAEAAKTAEAEKAKQEAAAAKSK